MLAPIEAIFCDIDNFCKQWKQQMAPTLLASTKGRRECKGWLQLSEIMTILVLFHLSNYRSFKDFYIEQQAALQAYLPGLIQKFIVNTLILRS